MKNGKKPTLAQKRILQSNGLIPNNWLVLKDTGEQLEAVSGQELLHYQTEKGKGLKNFSNETDQEGGNMSKQEMLEAEIRKCEKEINEHQIAINRLHGKIGVLIRTARLENGQFKKERSVVADNGTGQTAGMGNSRKEISELSPDVWKNKMVKLLKIAVQCFSSIIGWEIGKLLFL